MKASRNPAVLFASVLAGAMLSMGSASASAEVRWLYEENGDGTVTVTGVEPAAGNLTMPEELEGMAVTAVGTNAFKYCTGLMGMAVAQGVTNIGEEAFFHCDGLTNVTFGTNVTSIGIRAFWACRSLPAVEIPAGVTHIGRSAFYECFSLGSAVLPEGVTSVEESLFEFCSSLTNVTLGAGVTNIGEDAFNECTSLAAVTLPEGVASIEKRAFQDSGLTAVRIPNATTNIGDRAFDSCNALTDVQFGTGVAHIGECAFYNTRPTDVRLPNATETLGEEAFSHCANLTNIWLGTGIQSVGQGFAPRYLETLWVPVTRQGTELLDNAGVPAGCEIRYYGVQTVTFNGGEGTPTAGSLDYAIGETYEALPGATRALWTFTGWQAAGGAAVTETNIVTEATTRTLYAGWEEGVTTNGVRWLCRENGEGTVMVTGAVPAAGDLEMPETLDGYTVTAVKDNAFRGCTNLTGMAISGSVTNIGWSTFEGCTSLASVAIPGSVKEIGGAAFKSCASLTNAILGAGVANIGPYAFEYCGSLASVAFPEGLAEIQTGAFMNAGLTDARLPDTTERIGGDAFYGCESLTHAWIGTGIGSVGKSAFLACWNLAVVWVPVEKAGEGLLDPDWLADGCEIHYYGTQVATFDANGGKCGTATNGYEIGKAYGVLPVATWEGHDFKGWWATNAEGAVEVTTNSIVTEEATRTLEARWRLDLVALTVEAGPWGRAEAVFGGATNV
ncbi:MAG: leucine-rich repeat protein, partial [Kiritimatiellae bacterium]|nr:leucine-rich repeat protein [Kiritimatiellia bacterium]